MSNYEGKANFQRTQITFLKGDVVSQNKSLHEKSNSDCSTCSKQEPRKYCKNVSAVVQHRAQWRWKAEERLPASLVTRPVISHPPTLLDGSKTAN